MPHQCLLVGRVGIVLFDDWSIPTPARLVSCLECAHSFLHARGSSDRRSWRMPGSTLPVRWVVWRSPRHGYGAGNGRIRPAAGPWSLRCERRAIDVSIVVAPSTAGASLPAPKRPKDHLLQGRKITRPSRNVPVGPNVSTLQLIYTSILLK